MEITPLPTLTRICPSVLLVSDAWSRDRSYFYFKDVSGVKPIMAYWEDKLHSGTMYTYQEMNIYIRKELGIE